MQKGFINIIIIGVIAIIIAAAGYFAMTRKTVEAPTTTQETETTSKTAEPAGEDLSTKDWKTYRNEEYGFEIGHPANFVVKDWSFLSRNTDQKLFMVGENKTPRHDFFSIEIYEIKTEKDNLVLESALKSGVNAMIGKNNYLAKKFTKGDSGETYLLQHNGKWLEVTLDYWQFGRPEKEKINKELLNSILASLKLTEQKPVITSPIKITFPTEDSILEMDQRTYAIKWTTKDFIWHDGYKEVQSKNSKVSFFLRKPFDPAYPDPSSIGVLGSLTSPSDYIPYFLSMPSSASVYVSNELPFGAAEFNSGSYSWTLPYDESFAAAFLSQYYQDQYSQLSMLVSSSDAVNPYVIYSKPFKIKSLSLPLPLIKLTYPAGREKFKIGTPIEIQWSQLPKNSSYVSLNISPSPYACVISREINPIITSYTWDGKVFCTTDYKGWKEEIKPGEYKIILTFHMPDFSPHPPVESNSFTIISP